MYTYKQRKTMYIMQLYYIPKMQHSVHCTPSYFSVGIDYGMFCWTIFRKELEFSLECTNKRLQSSEEEVQQLKKNAEDNERKHRDQLSKLQSELEGRSNSLREYQMTVKSFFHFSKLSMQ